MHIKLSEIQEYLTANSDISFIRSGISTQLDCHPRHMSDAFGCVPGERFNIPGENPYTRENATVIGTSAGQLYFLLDDSRSIKLKAFDCNNRVDLERQNITLLSKKDTGFDYIHPSLQTAYVNQFKAVHQARSLKDKLGSFGDALGAKILRFLDLESSELHSKFSDLEKVFVNTQDLTLEDIRNYEEQYAELSEHKFVNENLVLFHYTVLRSLQLNTLKKGIDDPVLETIVAKKNAILIELANSNDLDIEFLNILASDADITLETRRDIAHILLSKIGLHYRSQNFIITNFIFSIGYCAGQEGPEDFADKLRALRIPFFDRSINDYLNNALKNAHKLANTKTKLGWGEAIKWYAYAIKHPELIKADDIKKLEDSVLLPFNFPIEIQKLQNEIRLWLCEKYLTSNNPRVEDVFLSIDTTLLEDHQQQDYLNIKKQHYFKKLQAIYQMVQELGDPYWQIKSDEIIEAREFKKRLQALLAQYANPTENQSLEVYEELLNNIREGLTQLFAERWEDIRKADLIYTHNTRSTMNQTCLALAKILDPKHKYQLLMPTLIQGEKENEEDLYGPILDGYEMDINDLEIGQFILTEDQTHFINIKDLIQIVIDNANRSVKPKIRHRLGGTYEELELTEKENASLASLIPNYKKLLKLAKARYKATQLTALGAFQQLRAGLQRGDYLHGSNRQENEERDENAGKDATIATAEFADWFTALPAETQAELKNLPSSNRHGLTFDYVYKQLTSQQHDRLDTSLCVHLLGGDLDSIIRQNQDRLSAIGHGRGSIQKENRWREATSYFAARMKNSSNIDTSTLERYKIPVDQSLEGLKNSYKLILRERQRLLHTTHRLASLYDHLLTKVSASWDQKDQLSPLSLETQTKDLRSELFLAFDCGVTPDKISRQQYHEVFPINPQARQLLNGIKRKAKTRDRILPLLQSARVGTTAYCIEEGVIKLFSKNGTVESPIHVDIQNQNTSFYIIENDRKVSFNTLQHATDEINITSVLGSDYPEVYNQFQTLNSVIWQAPTEELKQNLLTLRSGLLKETFSRLHAGTPSIDITQGNVGIVIGEVHTMMTQINSNQDQQTKLNAIKLCHDTLVPTQTAKTIGKAILALCITAVCTVVGGALGAGAGLVTGPGAAVTGIVGAVIGAGAAAAVTGVTAASLCSFGFFRRNAQEKTLDKTLDLATKQVSAQVSI